jgi:hypothetical protein
MLMQGMIAAEAKVIRSFVRAKRICSDTAEN